MIGGTDIVIPAVGDHAALDACARIVQREWPQVRFENAETGEKYRCYGEIPLARVRHLLASPGPEAEALWDADSHDSPPNSMLYLILSPDYVTARHEDHARIFPDHFVDGHPVYLREGSMNMQNAGILERLIRSNDLGWIIDMYANKEGALPVLLEQLDRVAVEYRRRFQVEIPFTPETLKAEAEKNPHRVRAFLQALAATRSPEMLVMVWRILQGLRIRQVDMNYREQESFSLVVVLARPGEEQDDLDDPYRSQDINDAALLRHFGITTVNGKPLFDGLFPLRKM